MDEFRDFLIEQCSAQRVFRANAEGEPYYSLTLLGTLYLPVDLRKKRDKFRAYLLRDAHRARFIESRGVDQGLAGASPASDTSSGIKGRAASKLGRPAFGGLRFALGRAYWPRIQRQFDKRTGLTRHSRDAFPSLLSYDSKEQVQSAAQRSFSFDYVGLGLCIGMSPQLIWKISRETSRHYRRFEIPKKGGGARLIESPRVFLKVIQWFLSDFVLCRLPTHDSVHSFTSARSIVTNAQNHERQKFVGNVDIENFFGSVTTEMVKRHFERNGFDQFEAVVLSNLSTNDGVLPQGAPTSPVISNSILFDFDTEIERQCRSLGLRYSRYADDITVSGSSRANVKSALLTAGSLLGKFGLRLNTGKTRIASASGQQRVTGVVVNSMSVPPRTYRRRVRSMFYEAGRAPVENVERIAELGGVLGFLKIFPKLIGANDIKRYESVLLELRGAQRSVTS